MRFHGWMISHLLNAQNLFLEANEGTMHPDLAAQVLTCNAKMLGTAGGHAWWSTARPTFHTEFTNHMEHLIDREAPIGEMWPCFLSEGEARS